MSMITATTRTSTSETQAMSDTLNRRILVIDDNPSIHDDFRKILLRPRRIEDLAEDRSILFAELPQSSPSYAFQIDCANQGQAGLALAEQAVGAEQPYAMAFVDMRMPPGWDGVETIEHLWRVDPQLEVVICTAFSDHAWENVLDRLGWVNDRLLILRKPFDAIEVQQLANALTTKWQLTRQADLKLEDLSALVEQRTTELRDMNIRLQHDITRRRKAEQQLAQVAEEVMGKNRELGRMNAELSEARDQALASAKAKSEFLAVMSHELRSPLSVIIGYASLSAEQAFGELSDEQVNVIQKIDRHARNLRELINSVLDFSRLEAGRLPIDMQAVQVSQVCEDVQAENAIWHEKPDLSCEWHIEADLPLMTTDPGKLKVVLKNLINNAVKFTEEGGITIRVCRKDWDVGDIKGIEISVADTGIGIADDILPIIFEPFRQGDSSDSRRYGGTGLGLHIVKRLVDLLGGSISVESQTEQARHGSVFQVWLPVDGPTQGRSPRADMPGAEPERLTAVKGQALEERLL